MKFTNSNYKILGVINRTPNSFSCSGYSLVKDHLLAQINLHHRLNVISDFGFESTAPMNQAISSQEEMERFHEFLSITKSQDFSGQIISFDTYRPNSFGAMCEAFIRIHPRIKGFIFNDVSGVLDEDLKKTLTQVKQQYKDKEIYYVYTFSFIANRFAVLEHNKNLRAGESIIESCVAHFLYAKNYLREILDDEHLLLDPGFGFSKTYEQNWDLIHRFGYLIGQLKKNEIKNTLLIGLSKKSFLRGKLGVKNPEETEKLHQAILNSMLSASSNSLLLRVHNPSILSN